jgi:hypothetical protein
MTRNHNLIAPASLCFCLLPLFACGPGGSKLQAYSSVTAPAPGTARVWFMQTKDPQEEHGDPIIFANGNQVGRSVPGIAFYHDFTPGTYAFTVQSYGMPTGAKDTVQLAPGTQTYLEVQWGGSWEEGGPGGTTFFVQTLSQDLGQAYLSMMTEKGPPQVL